MTNPDILSPEADAYEKARSASHFGPNWSPHAFAEEMVQRQEHLNRHHGIRLPETQDMLLSRAFLVIEAALKAEQAVSERLAAVAKVAFTVFRDGDQWCALYGANIQDGVAGFGATPEAACKAFDEIWARGEAGA